MRNTHTHKILVMILLITILACCTGFSSTDYKKDSIQARQAEIFGYMDVLEPNIDNFDPKKPFIDATYWTSQTKAKSTSTVLWRTTKFKVRLGSPDILTSVISPR